MLLPGESFPYRRLQDKDKNFILAVCDGPPVVNPDYLRKFLTTMGWPALGSFMNRTFFNDLGSRAVEALDARGPEAVKVFNRGVLFYAGTLQVATNVQEIPFQQPVMGKIADSNPRDLAMEGYQQVKDVESFADLMDKIRPALGTASDDKLHDIALAGAGVLHLATTQSVELLTDSSNSTELESNHPELSDVDLLSDLETGSDFADLRQLFEGFGDA